MLALSVGKTGMACLLPHEKNFVGPRVLVQAA
jgi:hypothetical protein